MTTALQRYDTGREFREAAAHYRRVRKLIDMGSKMRRAESAAMEMARSFRRLKMYWAFEEVAAEHGVPMLGHPHARARDKE